MAVTRYDITKWFESLQYGSHLFCVSNPVHLEWQGRTWKVTDRLASYLELTLAGKHSMRMQIPLVREVVALTEDEIVLRVSPWSSQPPYLVKWRKVKE